MMNVLTTKDGTSVAYSTTGAGPGVIVIPGVMSNAGDYAELAQALAGTFTVHVIERRGHGNSGPQGSTYSMGDECEDIGELQQRTGATRIFGHSYGGLIALQAARTNPSLQKIAVYEPGVSIGKGISMSWIPAYERYLAEGKRLDAFAAFSIAAGPRKAQKMPRWLMKWMLPILLNKQRLQTMLELLPANLKEHREIARYANALENYRDIRAKVLLMFGGKSDLPWVDEVHQALPDMIPSHEIKTFPKLDHFAPDQKAPREVALVVRDFLLGE
jgi:pimeloyl-ACP methyl ester carboxylesterase